MKVPEETLKEIFAAIDERQNEFVANLKEAVGIPSVSSEPARRPDCVNMVMWAKKKLEEIKVSVQVVEAGKQKLHDGTVIDLPPIIFGVLGTDPKKKTLLVYGHLDVQPAAKELTEVGGKLFGRGSTDDKGPVIAWIHAISVLQKKGVDIPVNLKFVFECMEESGSEGLEQALRNHKDDFLKNVDMTCISDNYWLGKNKPCLTYGLSPEAMNDLVWIMSQLTDLDGKIKIPGIYDLVAPLTDEEKKCYESIDFCMDTFQSDVAACGLLKNTKHEILMNRWRHPSLSLHGIEGAFSNPGAKTVIPSKVVGKFSIRIVPNMTPDAVDKLVVTYLNDLWSKRHSPNHFNAFPHHSGMPWVTDWKHENFAAGSRAIKRVFGVEPDYTREGGSIPITLVFQELTGNNVMLLPIGACDDMAHSQNEKLDRVNYIQGTKMMAAYLLELAA
ncbi:peptidase, M20/M25/M40 family [Ostertagia ostertagi]